ncbi:hypothetical protein [Bradyrhizobium macuxiense]|uniref:hypothetical protein n=1 Tax=Bradyrhizobium macuxiense TaxID=1755647 RepID=UPI001ABFA130|nr:hypothetical protein [Bradyrhizobium macuxiense]
MKSFLSLTSDEDDSFTIVNTSAFGRHDVGADHGAVLAGFLVIGAALPVLPFHVSHDLDFSTLVVGLVAGAQFAASLATRIWSGSYSDANGGKRSVVLGLIAAAAAGLLYLLSRAFFQMQVSAPDWFRKRVTHQSCCLRRVGKRHGPSPAKHSLRARGVRKISEYWKYTPDLPDGSSRRVERRQPPAPLHGVVFDILAARLRWRVRSTPRDTVAARRAVP